MKTIGRITVAMFGTFMMCIGVITILGMPCTEDIAFMLGYAVVPAVLCVAGGGLIYLACKPSEET